MGKLFDQGDRVPSSQKSKDNYELLHGYIDEIGQALRTTAKDPGARESALVALRQQVRAEFSATNLAADHYRNLERRIAEPLAEARVALVRREFPGLPQGFIARLGKLLSDWVFEDRELDEFAAALETAGLPADVEVDLLPKLEAWVEEDRPLIV